MMRFPRRAFLQNSGLAGLASILFPGRLWASSLLDAKPKVIHIHHGRAVRWPGGSGVYRNYMDQVSIDRMVNRGIRMLKGGTLTQAWKGIFSLSNPTTRKLAIKINCNNSTDPTGGAGTIIDAVPEPVIAVIRGFYRSGGLPANVTIYDLTSNDATRYIGSWFRSRVQAIFPTVKFADQGTNKGGAFNPKTHVTWSSGYSSSPAVTRIHDLVLNTDYIVNVPIVKRHIGANATLGFKNHFGSIERCGNLHSYVYDDVPNASVLADIMGSPVVSGDPTVRSIRQKTVLTVGDMLFGQPCKNYGLSPSPWSLFRGEWPNCLILSEDPVAADSVMIDLLEAEPAVGSDCGGIQTWARRYLQIAESKGQGVYDHVALPEGQVFDPALMTYTKINYRFFDIWPSGCDLRVKHLGNGSVRLEWEHYFSGTFEVRRSTNPSFTPYTVLGSTTQRYFVDNAPPAPSYYRVYYLG